MEISAPECFRINLTLGLTILRAVSPWLLPPQDTAPLIRSFQVNCRGLQALHLFVSRFDAMALLGCIVSHDQSVQAQLNDLGFVQLQPPKEQLVWQGPEQPAAVPRAGVAKLFDGVGRQQVFGRRLDGGSVSSILRQGIEGDQMGQAGTPVPTVPLTKKPKTSLNIAAAGCPSACLRLKPKRRTRNR